MSFVSRRIQSLNNRVFKRIGREEIREALVRLGLSAGDRVYAHVSMRRIGYVTGGPAEVAGAILDVIGTEGTLMMAAWPSAEPARHDPAEVFDVAASPSRSGLVSEAVRTMPSALRSLHPLASVACVGQMARDLVEGHEACETPFGEKSPYGRLASSSAKLLLVGAHLGGLLYHVLDRVGFPNLYDRPARPFEVRDAGGHYRRINSPTLRAIPPVVILPGSRPENRDYLLVPDYALMFPSERERRVMEAGYLRFNRSRFLGRRERLQSRGILTPGRVGGSEAALLDGARMIEQVCADLAWDIARFKEEYDADHLSRLSLPVF
ncbi:MAG TPA: AAC(3) family N-acetyltransferase [Candidatus Polarisedimenticolia bacterium]|nr:AAC(3) family N-acetyltransferase [Candidatus Polarisedimenticolia bacterium]